MSRLKIVAGVFVAAALVLPTSSAIALTAKGAVFPRRIRTTATMA